MFRSVMHRIILLTAATAAIACADQRPAKDCEAIEVVSVVEDLPERIALQHLLIVSEDGDKPRVIKHWAQIWTGQDTELLDYSGEQADSRFGYHKQADGMPLSRVLKRMLKEKPAPVAGSPAKP